MTTNFRTKLSYAMSLAIVLALLLAPLALADEIYADGDTTTPVDDNNINLGIVCLNQSLTVDIPVAIRRNGNYGALQVFLNGATVTVSVKDDSPGLLAVMDTDNIAVLPLDWGNFPQKSVYQVDIAWSKVTFTASSRGTYNGTVTYNASGKSSKSPYSTITLQNPETLSVTATVKDCTPPVITPTITGSLGNNNWYTSDITVIWSVTDLESGIAPTTVCEPSTINFDTPGFDVTCNATNGDGYSSSATVTIKRDVTAPVVSLIGGPADGESYYFEDVPPAPSCDATDATSGLAAPCAVEGYSNLVGEHTMTATDVDNAGNIGTTSISYTVLPWTLFGFYAPVDMGGVYNVVKGGSTVPLKFEIFKGEIELTDISKISSFIQQVTCPTTAPTDSIEEYATGSTSLRYDEVEGQFIFNWQTLKKPGTCYLVTMTTLDGSSLVANFKLK